MIRFLGKTKEGDERVAVVDWFHRNRGEVEFTFRAQSPDEPMFWYLDRVMNEYYWRIGKNIRRWQDE